LALFVGLSLPLLYGLAYYAGFTRTRGLRHDLLDTFGALAVGFFTAALLLTLFGVIGPDSSPRALAAHLGLQAVPGAFGALLARRQLSAGEAGEGDEGQASYSGELFLMAAG